MNWTLGGIRIFVVEHNEETSQIVAGLQPLSGGTIYHRFGHESISTKLSAYVVGSGDKAALQEMVTVSSGNYELTSPEGSLGNYIVQNVSMPRQKTVRQTLRPDLSCDAEVYLGDITLLLDE